jgi:hypothetical protein
MNVIIKARTPPCHRHYAASFPEQKLFRQRPH